jgi:hypothetical protein
MSENQDVTFRISSDLCLPRESVTWVISYLAKRGAGKTYCSSVQAEEMLKAQIPIVVIDGMGIWWGLRVKNDGVHEGLPVVVFGGEHADLPLIPEKAGEMAKAIVESNISCVLDLSPFSKYAARKIISAFLNDLYRLNRVERHVFIEESDMWAMQRPIGQDEALCLSAVDNFVRRGGNHNLGCTLITQRSAVLNKDILTQSDCLVVLRTLAPQDKKAIQAWVEEQTDEDKKQLKEWYDSLKSLENGEAWIWHPEKPMIFKKIQFRTRETFHATREFIRSPRAGKIVLMDVDEFIQKFKRVFEPKPVEPVKTEKTVQNVAIATPPLPKPGLTIRTILPTPPPQPSPMKLPEVLPAPSPEPSSNTVQIVQALPNIQIQQYKPTLMVPVEILNEPTTALGKVVVVLKNDAMGGGRQDKWTGNRIKSHVREHGWDDNGADEAISQLVRWEILKKQSNNYLRFYPQRVEITQNNKAETVT